VLDYAAHFDEPCDRAATWSKDSLRHKRIVVAKIDAVDDCDEASNPENAVVKAHVEHHDDEDVVGPSVDLSRTGGYMTSRTRLAGITHLHECAT
jgi:hypothetical protein